jgi:hypothetical protein
VLVLVPRYSRPVALADVGTTAPDFQLRDTSGRPVALADHRGHAVVLFFNGGRHAYDVRINKLAEQYAADSRVTFLALDQPSRRDEVGDLAQVASASIITPDERLYPTLIDTRGVIARRYSADALPMVVVIDSRGLVRYRGPIDDNGDPAFVTRSFASEVLLDLLDERPSAPVAVRK